MYQAAAMKMASGGAKSSATSKSGSIGGDSLHFGGLNVGGYESTTDKAIKYGLLALVAIGGIYLWKK